MNFNKFTIFAVLLLFLAGSSKVLGVTYQVEPEIAIPDGALNFTSICATANPGLSCVANADGSLLQPYFLPTTKSSCSSVVVKALITENTGYWKCIVVNVGPATPSNPERVVIFGNDTIDGSPLLRPFLSSFAALGTASTVEAQFGDQPDTVMKVTVNANVTLNCTSDSITPSQYIWEYRNATNGLWRVFSHAQNVTVTGVFGELWCSAWNKLGPVRSRSTLTIQNLDDDASTLPMVSAYLGKLLVFGPPANVEAHTASGENEIAVSVLEPVQLYCTSDAGTPSKYIWEYRNDVTGFWRVFHHGRNLTVRGVYGELWCSAWNSFGPVRSSSTIKISRIPAGPAEPLLAIQSPFLSSFVAMPPPAPAVSVDASFDTEGLTEKQATSNDTVNMYCTSNASYHSRYIWFYRNNATGALRVMNTAANVTVHGLYGEFWCSVWTRFGSTSSKTTLQITHAPEWVTITSSIGAAPIIETHKNESVDLSCTSDAYPAADYRWERRDPGKPWKVYALTQDILVPGKKGGELVCVASNLLGEIRSSEVVIVIEAIKVKPLLSNTNSNKETSSAGVDSGIAIVGGGLVAAVLVMLIVLGATVNRYRRRGTYKELKKQTRLPEDSHSAGERRALVMAAPY